MRERWIAAGLLFAIAATGALVVVVLRFGIENPSPPSLADAPRAAIPGEIVYRSDQHCVTRIEASGATPGREICLPALEFYGEVAWADERTLVVISGRSLVTVDLETGLEIAREDVSQGPVFAPADRSPAGDVAAIDRDGRLQVISGTSTTEVADFDTSGWRLRVVTWSPDSQWLVLGYVPPRSDRSELWIVSRDGSVKGTLAVDAWQLVYVSWRIDGVGVTPERSEGPSGSPDPTGTKPQPTGR